MKKINPCALIAVIMDSMKKSWAASGIRVFCTLPHKVLVVVFVMGWSFPVL